jgi:hypothetical protein
MDRVRSEIVNENQMLKEQVSSIKNEYKKKLDAIHAKKSDEFKSIIDEINQEHDVFEI